MMFREGYYLEVIKTKHSAATAVITVKEKTVEIGSKKTTTNKWLTLEDWYFLYEILEKALLQNVEKTRSPTTEKRKLTRRLEISYTLEASENPEDRTSLPTLRAIVSPAKKRSKHKTESTSSKKARNKDNAKIIISSLGNDDVSPLDCLKVEEYIPDAPIVEKNDSKSLSVGYVPSRKSTLEYLQQSANSNEYVPSVLAISGGEEAGLGSEALYVPNSIPKHENLCETYEPSSLTASAETGGEYIPNSMGVRKKVEEYQPNFVAMNKTMKFDNSYVPSSSQRIKELKKNYKKISRSKRRRRSKNREEDAKQPSHPQLVLAKKNSPSSQTEIKREM